MDGMVPAGIVDVAPWPDWTSAADGALQFLFEHIGWDAWVVTRVAGERQVVLRSYPPSVVPPGTDLPWADSFCRHMLSGEAPRVATVTAAVPAYAKGSSGPIQGIAAYVGVPLVTADLQLFGTLCGLSFRAKPRSAARDLPLVETISRMLSTLLAAQTARPPDAIPAPARSTPN
jgi:GAF domain-containing protein